MLNNFSKLNIKIFKNKCNIKKGIDLIQEDDIILTFSKSRVISQLFKKAKDEGKNFTVVCVDNPPFNEGRIMINELTSHKINCIYTLFNSVSKFMKKVSKVKILDIFYLL